MPNDEHLFGVVPNAEDSIKVYDEDGEVLSLLELLSELFGDNHSLRGAESLLLAIFEYQALVLGFRETCFIFQQLLLRQIVLAKCVVHWLLLLAQVLA